MVCSTNDYVNLYAYHRGSSVSQLCITRSDMQKMILKDKTKCAMLECFTVGFIMGAILAVLVTFCVMTF